MTFEFNNVGIVSSAKIDVKGLTVLAGLNDTGKSFVSKLIYSVIKTTQNYATTYLVDKYNLINNQLAQIRSYHRQILNFNSDRQNIFNTQTLSNKLAQAIIGQLDNNIIDELKSYKSLVIKDIDDNAKDNANYKRTIDSIKLIFNTIDGLLLESFTNEKKAISYFDKYIIQTLFREQLNTLGHAEKVLNLKMADGETNLLNITVENNRTLQFEINDTSLIKDVSLIDTPMILQMEAFITNTLAFNPVQQQGLLPSYYSDLLSKIRVPAPLNILPKFLPIYSNIQSLIKGSWSFSADEGTFIFSKVNGAKIKTVNVATGIKSLGIIQLLISGGILNDNTILIIDEPEVHLHPSWEVAYAEMLVLLSKIGVKIIISTHSPYMVEAIAKFSEEHTTVDKTEYYFSKAAQDELTNFERVTKDLTPIFDAFAAPMKSLFKV